MARQTEVRKGRTAGVSWTLPLGARNWRIIGLGLALVVIGYGLMSVGIFTRYDHPIALTVAPIVLVVAYLVLIPYGILARSKGSSQEQSR